MKHLIKVLLGTALLSALNVGAQQKIFLNADGGIGISHIISYGTLTRIYGATVGVKTTEKIDLEGGYYRVTYNVPSMSWGFRANQISIRGSYNKPIGKRKLVLVPAMGVRIGIRKNFGFGTGVIDSAGMFSIRRKIEIGSEPASGTREIFPLLELRLGTEYTLSKTISVGLNASYHLGFKKIATTEFINANGQTIDKVFTKGDFLALSVNVKYNISSLFKTKG